MMHCRGGLREGASAEVKVGLNSPFGRFVRSLSPTCSDLFVSTAVKSMISAWVCTEIGPYLARCAMRAVYCCLILFPRSASMNRRMGIV